MIELLVDPNVLWVLGGAIALGIACGGIGSLLYLRRESLVGDMLAHAALPGVTSAFLLTGSRSIPVLGAGAIVSCYLAKVLYRFFLRVTHLKADTVTALVLSVSFGIGLFQLSLIQRSPVASVAGIDRLIFGQAAALGPQDLHWLIGIAIVLSVLLVLLRQRLQLVLFDPLHAKVLGLPLRMYEAVIAGMVVLAVVAGLQLVGVVLVAALLIIPPAMARSLVRRFSTLLVLSAAIGGVGAAAGVILSLLFVAMPTGPCIAVTLGVGFVLVLLCNPQRGILVRWVRQRRERARLDRENLLRTLYKIGEERNASLSSSEVSMTEVRQYRTLSDQRASASVRSLVREGYVIQSPQGLTLTTRGVEFAATLTRRHRLWEAYLSQTVQIPADHVHDDAEELEHFLTLEIEGQLRSEMRSVQADPHGKAIPPPQGEKP